MNRNVKEFIIIWLSVALLLFLAFSIVAFVFMFGQTHPLAAAVIVAFFMVSTVAWLIYADS